MYDSLGTLVDGSIVITPSTDTPAVSTTRDAATGAAVIDLKKTGHTGLCAVLVCPTKPTTYDDTLTAFIEQSDTVGEPTSTWKTWQAVGDFPIVYAMTRIIPNCKATTAFVSSDVGRVLTATTLTASDGGHIIWYDPALETIGGVGSIIIAMSDANDLYTTASDTLTATSGTGIATASAATTASMLYPNGDGLPGIFVTRFRATKRYVRLNMTVSSGGSYGYVSCYLAEDAPMAANQVV